MLSLNFYKVRTGMDITPKDQGGDDESQARYDQILQTVNMKGEIEYLHDRVLTVIEKNPIDLGAYQGNQLKIYILILAVDKERSSWTASDLHTTLGNMRLSTTIKTANPSANEWIGGAKNNISAEAAYFDLRTKKKKGI